jgi:hypothetical protein
VPTCHWIRAHDDAFVQVAGVDDIHRARREGKLAVSFDFLRVARQVWK